MHIKKVEIFGFKSFGFKNTTVPFEQGLVSISGPNGSGKSNILDAIIFALGENRPKTMRVDKLRSLLHDIEGAARRGPKMARASVHFDNSDRKIPIDSDFVEVTREMDDKGENIYYINKKKTNRSHVLDLLDVANAGLNQLNAVQQGTVTRISEFSPEEKREAIENLIGLSYFDEKKAESIKQLDEADRRLEIALARMDEIKKRIDELEEEKNHKHRYDFLEREINRYNAIAASNKLKTIKTEKLSKERNLHALSSELKKFGEEHQVYKKQIHELDSQKSQFMDEVNAYNQAKATIDSELSGCMQKFEEANSTIITADKRLGQINSRLPELTIELEQLHGERNSIESQVTEQKQSIQKINDGKKQVNDEIKSLDQQISKVMREQSHITSKKIEVDGKIKNLTEKLNAAKLALSKLESENKDTQNKINTNTIRSTEYEQEIEKLTNLKQKLSSVTTNHKATASELKSRISKLNAKRTKIENDMEELSLILEKSTKAANQYEAKIRVVKNIMHEDYSTAKLKEDADKLGIQGLVYEMLSWDKQYERAVLAVSSDWIKALVVQDFETLVSLAEVARSKKLPKIKIIPLNAIPKFKLTLPDAPGVVGVLSDYVKCNNKFSPIKTFLFGNVVLVNSRESARALSQSGYRSVTVDGEYFEAKSGAVIIDINSKISNLTKVISMSTSVDGLVQAIRMLKKYTLKKKFALKKVEKTIQNYKDRLSVSETGLANANLSDSDLKLKIISATNMKKQLLSRISQLNRAKERIQTEFAKQDSYVLSLSERISLVQENYAEEEQSRIATDLAKLNENKSSIIAKQTEVLSEFREQSTQLTTLTSQENSLKSRMRTLHEENSTLKTEQHELEVKLRTVQKEKDAADEELIKLREKEQELISTSGTSVSKLKEFDDSLRELNDKDRTLTKEINSLERQSDSINRDLADLTENETKIQKMLQSFGFTDEIESYDVEPILQALYAEQRTLTALNAKAPETYLEVSTGYRSMSARKNSLEEERNSIVRFVEEIEKDKRQTFLDAFDKVDKEIRTAFTKMTGGNAWLELQNEDDIFSSGISYLIQFPSKPKRESTSISGGEKTLAAIVFVLALQKLKPSPFYLFDEVDAHLDAPNSERLSKILEERAKESQFIMVSLKDSVVQKAKLIYGVYPKNGVSHVVTYKDKRLPSMASG